MDQIIRINLPTRLVTLSKVTGRHFMQMTLNSFERLNRYLDDVKWLSVNKFKLNPDKTVFIIFGLKLHHEKLKSFLSVNILGNPLHLAKVVKFWSVSVKPVLYS